VEERVWVLHQKPQADRSHFVLELKLHVEFDRVGSALSLKASWKPSC
jgi:hypothetical protein